SCSARPRAGGDPVLCKMLDSRLRGNERKKLEVLPMASKPITGDFDESSPRYFGWRVVIACFLMALACWGFGLYGHSVYLAETQRLHGWPPQLIAGPRTA